MGDELRRLVHADLQARYDQLDETLGLPRAAAVVAEVQELRDGAWRTVPVAERHPSGFVVTDRRRAR